MARRTIRDFVREVDPVQGFLIAAIGATVLILVGLVRLIW
jgi:hypothetical protein